MEDVLNYILTEFVGRHIEIYLRVGLVCKLWKRVADKIIWRNRDTWAFQRFLIRVEKDLLASPTLDLIMELIMKIIK